MEAGLVGLENWLLGKSSHTITLSITTRPVFVPFSFHTARQSYFSLHPQPPHVCASSVPSSALRFLNFSSRSGEKAEGGRGGVGAPGGGGYPPIGGSGLVRLWTARLAARLAARRKTKANTSASYFSPHQVVRFDRLLQRLRDAAQVGSAPPYTPIHPSPTRFHQRLLQQQHWLHRRRRAFLHRVYGHRRVRAFPRVMNVARDVIFTQGDGGLLHSTAFVVNFKPVGTLYKWLVSRPALAPLHLGGSTHPPSPSPSLRQALSVPSTAATTTNMSAQKGSSNVDSPRSSASWAGSRYGSDDGNCDDVFNEEEDRREGPANTLASFILSSIGFTGSPFPPPSSAAAHGRRPSWRGGSGGGEGDGREIRSPSTGPPSVDQQERHQQRRRQQQEEEEHHQQQQHHHHARREGVEVYVRGRLVSELEMVVDGNGACVFADTGTMQPSSAALQSLSQLGKERGEGVGLLRDGANPVEFVYCSPYGDLSVKATFHLWGARDRVVVSDIDGTITKSDIRGYIHSVHLGSHHHTHRGIGRLFSHLEQAHHLRFVYLTSRPISLLDATRTYLANVEQDEGYGLPQGPVFTSMDSLTRVLYKELVEKTIRYMKAQVLNEISSTFHRAGRPEEDRVFLLGFGNKSADGQAYEMVGVDPDSIFIINPNSEVRMFASYKESSFSSFPRPFDWRRSLSPNAMSSEAAKRKRTSKKKGGREGEEEGIEDEEEEEGDVGPAQGVMAMSRGRYEGEGGKEGGKDEEGHTTTTFDSYSDERLLRLLERRLARDAEGKDEHENV